MLELLWDGLLVGLMFALTLAMPDVFPAWLAFGALPLLACRATISRMDAQLR